MPLHLLHHKSWHVGSIQNQERVRRDERNAKLKEEEEEQRMQEIDAERRMTFLRKQLQDHNKTESELESLTSNLKEEQELAQVDIVPIRNQSDIQWGRRDQTRKRRRDDDESDLKITRPSESVSRLTHASSNAPITGHDGHINLFPQAVQGKSSTNQNPEYLADKAREVASYEAQYNIQLTRPPQSWYESLDNISQKDKEKSGRRRDKDERVERRIREEHDPLQAIKSGLDKLREVKAEQAVERRQRDADVGLGANEKVLRSRRRDSLDLEYKHERSKDKDNPRRDRSRDRSRDRKSNHKSNRSHHDEHRHKSSRPSNDEDRSHSRYRRHSHRSRSRSKSRQRSDHNIDRQRSSKTSRGSDKAPNSATSSIAMLREEAEARERRESYKAETLVEEERQLRNPEHWTAASGPGRGKYSRQFGP